VANRLAAMPPAQETNGFSCATTPVPVPRIGVPLLLKTILLHPAAATGAPTGRIFLSIAAREAGSNEGTLSETGRRTCKVCAARANVRRPALY
jgi:hypothetical protein